MITLRDRCKTESINFAIANFLDDFRANPSVEYIQDSVLDLENLSVVEKATLAAVVDAMCSECHISRPEWIFDPVTYLDKPHFTMNAKGSFRIVLLRESPKWFRSRNLFVTANCLERV